ncbi:MAG: VacB/RNase II family 3'-5' exoribonuclease [Deltaproteobacteria bacterium]|nr:VacB/RNase II family 3'-5' exoribonuclease [Deltaproteobacteria bacterium]
MHPLDQKIISLLAGQTGRPLNRRELAGKLHLHGAERKLLTARLKRLQKTGQLVMNKRGGYQLLPEAVSLEGTVTVLAEGFGFFQPLDGATEDLYIPARSLAGVMNGDRVLVQPLRAGRDGRLSGRIIKVLQRAHRSVLGIYQQQRGRNWVMPLDPTIAKTVFVQPEGSLPATPGQVVELELVRYPTATSVGSGRIVAVLGDQEDPAVDIETVIRSHGLPQFFSPEALAEAEAVAEVVSTDEIARRIDLRDLPLMTIDGETAKDFDDAVALRKEGKGNFRLWGIADVAHYVAEGGALDLAARERGTSVYFPGYCLPMLPERLSNGLCSLNPEADRLVMVAEMLFNHEGQRLNEKFYPAVICSRARLTYTEVAAALDSSACGSLSAEVAAQLPPMAELAEVLGEMRRKRGSLELDVPDLEIILDPAGRPVNVVKTERTIAHRLIEEFMLAANEAVAAFLQQRNFSFLYRIHEPPDFDKSGFSTVGGRMWCRSAVG